MNLKAEEAAYVLGIAEEGLFGKIKDNLKARKERKEAIKRYNSPEEKRKRELEREKVIAQWKPERDKIESYCKSLYKKYKSRYSDLYFEDEDKMFAFDDGEILFSPQGEFGIDEDEEDGRNQPWDMIYKCNGEIENELENFLKPLATALFKRTGISLTLRANNDHLIFTIETGGEKEGYNYKKA